MTAAVVIAPRAQRVVLPGGEVTWTVVGSDHLSVKPAEEYLEFLRAQRMSPNTVKSYARALGLWWEFLTVTDRPWAAVTIEDLAGFLTWLRTGNDPMVTSLEARPARFAESTINVRLRAVMSLYRYHLLNGVTAVEQFYEVVHGRGGPYKPMLEHVARRNGRERAVVRVRRPHALPQPTLTPRQIDAIVDACAVWDDDGREWRGSVRDRLFWTVLAETGFFSRGRLPGSTLSCVCLQVGRLVGGRRRSRQLWCM